jgi:hypothetical protein
MGEGLPEYRSWCDPLRARVARRPLVGATGFEPATFRPQAEAWGSRRGLDQRSVILRVTRTGKLCQRQRSIASEVPPPRLGKRLSLCANGYTLKRRSGGFLPSLVARRARKIGEVSRDVQTCRRAAQLTPVLGGRSSARAADPPARLVARAIGRLAPRLPPLRQTARAGADAPGRQTRPPALSIRLRTRRRPRARRSAHASARQLARQARSRRSSCASWPRLSSPVMCRLSQPAIKTASVPPVACPERLQIGSSLVARMPWM